MRGEQRRAFAELEAKAVESHCTCIYLFMTPSSRDVGWKSWKSFVHQDGVKHDGRRRQSVYANGSTVRFATAAWRPLHGP